MKTKNNLASVQTAHKKPNIVFILVDNIGWGNLASVQTAHKKPNIVFILVDNIGWGDFSVYGASPTRRP